MKIKERLIRCFAAVFSEREEKTIPFLEVGNTKEWDSLAFVMLMNVVQQEFSIEIPIGELEQMNSFEKFLQKVELLVKEVEK